MIKSMMGQSDDEMLEAICCDVRYKYALHTTSWEEQPISDRTFSRFRERLYNYEVVTGIKLLDDEMKALAGVYQNFMNLHSNIKRMDSMMIATSAKRMSRLEIIYTVNANAVKLMHELGADEQIPLGLEHYLLEEDRNDVIYYCKDEDVTTRLEKVIVEAEQLLQAMNSDQWLEFSQYQLLLRVLKEQTKPDDAGNLTVKANQEISSSSLQNPSDPDATFREKAGKAHKGYVGNIVETVDEEGHSLITDFAFQPNTYSDSSFCKEQIKKHAAEAATPAAQALGASPGAACGKVVFSAEDAKAWAARGEKVVLVRLETSPEDIEGMKSAQGVLTVRGGMTSHAAVVARGMGKCCVSGCGDIVMDEENKKFTPC